MHPTTTNPKATGERVALIVVDVQNDFADPQGSLFVAGAPAIMGEVNGAIDAARATGAFVVYSQDWHPAHTPHFARDGGIWPVHCVADSWGAALHPDLRPDPDLVIHKGSGGEDGYSAFTMRAFDGQGGSAGDGTIIATPLTAELRARGIEVVLVCGLATDYCVKATALDAVAAGFGTILLLPAVAAVDLAPGDGERALAAMDAAGVKIVERVTPDPAPEGTTIA